MFHLVVDNVVIQEAYTLDLAEYYASVIKEKFAECKIEIVTTL